MMDLDDILEHSDDFQDRIFLSHVSESMGAPIGAIEEMKEILFEADRIRHECVLRHKSCGRALGPAEPSKEALKEKFDRNELFQINLEKCSHCGRSAWDWEEVEIEYRFYDEGQ